MQSNREDMTRARSASQDAESAAARARILVVDDDEVARRALQKLLHAEGFPTSAAPDGEAALAEAKRATPDVVLTDLAMEPMGGIELCQRVHELDRDLPVIVMTGFSDMASVVESLRVGAEDYLIKPLQSDAVLWCVNRAVARRAASVEQERLRQRYRTLNERLVLSSARERAHAEAEAQQRAQLGALLANLKEGVAVADPSGRILMINDAARVILGAGDIDLQNIDALHALDAHDLGGHPLPSEQRPLMRALRGEHFVDYEILRVRPNGERRRVVSTGTSVRGPNGDIALAIVLFRDVTELRRLEQQRDEYLALFSHDLRTPLSCVLLLVATIRRSMERKGITEETLVGLADRAERNVQRMTVMLDELAEATSLESNDVALCRVACDLRDLVASVIDRMDDGSARRITIETDGTSPHVVFADASRLEHVLENLLTNALKYSAEDAPVKARLTREGGNLALDVIDRGIGIAPESVQMLFDRYYRTTAGKARASGLGLGLYIARLIVEAHGGRIDVSSEIGKGSTFRLILPSSPPPG